MKSTFARRISILLVLAMVLAMLPVAAMAADSTTLYLQPNSNWLIDSPRFAAYFFGNGETWVNMTDADADGIYEVEAPAGYPNVIFCRMNPNAAANNWNNKWNQTKDLTVPADGTNLYIVKPGTWDKGAGTWDTFTPGDEVTEATTVPNAYKYYVAGDFNTWNECNDDYGLTLVDGVYTLTLELAAGTYTFKVTDGTWTNSWGLNGTDSNYEFVLDADATVVITFDDTTKVPTVTSSAMGEVTIYDYYLTGDMNGWTVNSSSMGLTANGDGTYSITIDMVAGTYDYKFTNGTWDVCFPAGMDNASITVAADCAVTFTLDPVAGTFTATGEGIGETPVVPPVDITAVNVKGTIPGIDWDADSVTGAMELVDGIYTITFPAVPASEVGAAAYAFKVMVNNSWDTTYPESDWTFYLNAECDVTITFNPADNSCAIYADGLTYDVPGEGGEDPVDPPVTEDVFNVKGDVAGLDWDLTSGTGLMTKNEDGSYSLTIAGVAAATKYSIKVVKNNSWDFAIGGEGAGGNYEFAVNTACDVTITVAADGTLSVTGVGVGDAIAAEIVVESVVVAGSGDESGNGFLYGVNWDPASSVNKMTLENGVYTITYTGVAAGTYQFKFALNGSWTYSYASGVEVVSGETTTAWYNPLGNSTVVVAEDNSTVTLVLDLTNVTVEGDNAEMTVTVEAPVTSGAQTSAPDSLVIGDNNYEIGDNDFNIVESTFTATEDGSLNIFVSSMSTFDSYVGEWSEPSSAVGMAFMMGRYMLYINGEQVMGYSATVDVKAGDVVTVGLAQSMYGGMPAKMVLTIEKVCDHVWTYNYTAGVSHEFVCDVCGKSVSAADTDSKKFRFNTASPALAVDIVMNIAITLPEGFYSPYMVIEFNGVTTELYDCTYNETNGRYEYAFPGINPQVMGDTFYATLYATVEGVEVSVELEYSMLKYINSQLKKASTPAALITALSDLVMYGEANQIYEGYKTDALLSTLLDDAAKANLAPSTFTALDDSYNKQATAGTKDANIDLKGVTMALGSKVMVRMTVFCADASAYTVKATINGEDFLYPVSELSLAAGYTDRYVVEFDQIRATQFGEEITFSFLDADGNQVGRTLTYTVYTYVQKNQNADNEKLVNLLKAIYNYGESVKNI